MSDNNENAEIVRRGYAAFNASDIDALTQIFDEASSWYTPGRSLPAGERHGRDNVLAQFGRSVGNTDGTFKARLKKIFVSDDGSVIGFHHNSGDRNGKRLDTDCCIVFEVADGRIVSGGEHFYDLGNWDDFWS